MIVFLSLVLSFLLLIFGRQIFIDLLYKIASPSLAQGFYFFIFFPGVIVHELSHFLVATLLMVPTGEISLFPEGKRMGSVQIAKTDPIRTAIIGLAPMIVGTAVIIAIFLLPLNLPPKILGIQNLVALIQNKKNWLWLYLIFAINNTMFASESDRRSWLGLVALLILTVSILYLFGLFSIVIGPFYYYATMAAELITTAYISTFIINIIFTFPLFCFQKIIDKSGHHRA